MAAARCAGNVLVHVAVHAKLLAKALDLPRCRILPCILALGLRRIRLG